MSVTAGTVALSCWLLAAHQFNVPVGLLQAIAHVESGDNCGATHVNKDGSRDMGCMQINSRWLPVLRRSGIIVRDPYERCGNVYLGAWILSQGVDRYGYSWEAIGAYNAGPLDARTRVWKLPLYREYARKVLSYWKRHFKS